MMKLVKLLTVLALGATPGRGSLHWREIQHRAATAATEQSLVPLRLGLSEKGSQLELEFDFLGETVSAQLAADNSLFDASFVHHVVGRRSSSIIAEDTKCLYSDHDAGAFVSMCGSRLSAYVETESGRQVHLELASDLNGELLKLREERAGHAYVQALAYVYRSEMDPEWSCGNDQRHDTGDHFEFAHHADKVNGKEKATKTEADKSRLRAATWSSPTKAAKSAGRKLDAGQKRKYIKLVIVNDKERYNALGDSTFAMSADLIQRVQLHLNNFNQKSVSMGGYRLEVQVIRMLSFQHADPWQIDSNSNGEVGHSELLTKFTNWRQNMLAAGILEPHGAAHLLSGHNFEGSVVGYAYVDELCSEGYATAVVQTKGLSQQVAATTTAHELMHNIGVSHTNIPKGPNTLVPEACNDGGYIMDPSGTSSSKWSDCTVNHVKMAFGEQGYPAGCKYSSTGCTYWPRYGSDFHNGACADTRASAEWTLEPECGNGVVEQGEECDCPNGDCSGNPCCDSRTCKLVSGAECNPDDACCTPSCKLVAKSANLICRAPVSNQCGVAETCNGVDSTCPVDVHKPVGTPCDEGGENGACFGGVCQSHQEQCRRHLGSSYGACPRKDHDDGAKGCGDLWCSKKTDPSRCTRVVNNADGESYYAVENGTPCGTTSDDNVCSEATCASPKDAKLPVTLECFNGKIDPGETDVDCGGNSCLPCLPRERCLADTDCASGPGEPGKCEFQDPRPTPAPTFGTDLPAGGCTSSSQDVCQRFSGCVWLSEFGVCRRSGHFPRGSSCTLEAADEDCCDGPTEVDNCVNWSMCRWESDKCVMAPTVAPTPAPDPNEVVMGQCKEYSSQSDGQEDTAGSFWVNFWIQIQDNLVLVVCVGGGSVLLGVSLAMCVCYQSCRTPKDSPNKFVAHRHRTRSSLPSDQPVLERASSVSVLRATRSSASLPSSSSSFAMGENASGAATLGAARPMRGRPTSTPASTAGTLMYVPSATAIPSYAIAPAPATSRCPRCSVNYSNPRNQGGLCNACNSKALQTQQQRRSSRRSSFSSTSQDSSGDDPVDTTATTSVSSTVPSPAVGASAAASPAPPAPSTARIEQTNHRGNTARTSGEGISSQRAVPVHVHIASIVANTEPSTGATSGSLITDAVVVAEPVVFAVSPVAEPSAPPTPRAFDDNSRSPIL